MPDPQPAQPATPARNSTREEVDTAAYWDAVYAEAQAEVEAAKSGKPPATPLPADAPSPTGAPGWDLAGPNPELIHQLDHAVPPIRPGKIIVPGCGYGHDVLELARRGFDVTALDFSPRAIEGTRARLAAANLHATCIEADFFAPDATLIGAFDLLYEYTCFCAIHPDRRAEYAAVAAKLLKPGGQLIGCFYWHQRDGGPPYDTPPEAVRAAFSPHFDCRTLAIAQHSPERRKGHELWARFLRR